VCDTQGGADIETTKASDFEHYSYELIYLKRNVAETKAVKDVG